MQIIYFKWKIYVKIQMKYEYKLWKSKKKKKKNVEFPLGKPTLPYP